MAENTVSTLSGLLKKVYGDGITKVIPEFSVLQDAIPFAPQSKRIGDKYVISVALAGEHGITFAGPGSGAFSFNNPISSVVRQAEVDSNQILGQSEIDFEVASKAISANSAASFANAMDHVMEGLIVSMRKKLETVLFYGGVELATVGSVSGNVLTIPDSEWASGIWAGAEGAAVDIHDSTTGALKQSTYIIAVNLTNKKITVGNAGTAAANDTLHWGGSVGNVAMGVHKILTTRGNLFGIDNTNYSLWQGNSYDVGGALSFAKLDEAVSLSMDKGYQGNMTLLVNPKTWSNLMLEQAAKRQYVDNSDTFKNGASRLLFPTQVGTVEVKSSTLVKAGYGYIINKEDFRRVGTVDVKLGDPLNEDSAVTRLTNKAGYQIVAYSNQSLFCERPGYSTVLTGITNS